MHRKPALVSLLAVLGILCVACEDLRGESGRVDTPGEMSIFSLRVGDCLNVPQPEEFADVHVIPCAEPHELEVFAMVEHPADDRAVYPERDIDQVAFDLCYAFFASYVGTTYENSRFEINAFLPTRESWIEADDRGITCILFDPVTGSMYGTMKGSRR